MVSLGKRYELLLSSISLIKGWNLVAAIIWESLHIMILNDRDRSLMLLLVYDMLILCNFRVGDEVLCSNTWLLDLIVLQELLFV